MYFPENLLNRSKKYGTVHLKMLPGDVCFGKSLGTNRVQENRELGKLRRESKIHRFGEEVWVDPVQKVAAEILHEHIVQKNAETEEISFRQLLIAGLPGSCEIHELRDDGFIAISRVSYGSDAVDAK